MLHLDEPTKLTFHHTRNSSSQKTHPLYQAYLPLQWLMLPVTGMAEVGVFVVCWMGDESRVFHDGKVRIFLVCI